MNDITPAHDEWCAAATDDKKTCLYVTSQDELALRSDRRTEPLGFPSVGRFLRRLRSRLACPCRLASVELPAERGFKPGAILWIISNKRTSVVAFSPDVMTPLQAYAALEANPEVKLVAVGEVLCARPGTFQRHSPGRN